MQRLNRKQRNASRGHSSTGKTRRLACATAVIGSARLLKGAVGPLSQVILAGIPRGSPDPGAGDEPSTRWEAPNQRGPEVVSRAGTGAFTFEMAQ